MSEERLNEKNMIFTVEEPIDSVHLVEQNLKEIDEFKKLINRPKSSLRFKNARQTITTDAVRVTSAACVLQ